MNIRDYRIRAGLKQYEAAQKLSIHKDYLSMIERGVRQPSKKLILKMAELYNASPEAIFKAVICTTPPHEGREAG